LIFKWTLNLVSSYSEIRNETKLFIYKPQTAKNEIVNLKNSS